MTHYCRNGSKSHWHPGANPTAQDRDDNRGWFLLRQDESGLSLWRTDNDADLSLVLAAVMFNKARGLRWRPEIQRVDLLRVPEAMIQKFGTVEKRTIKEPTVLPSDRLHHELEWSPIDLQRLADHLAEVEAMPCASFDRKSVQLAVRALSLEDVAEDARTWLSAMKDAAA